MPGLFGFTNQLRCPKQVIQKGVLSMTNGVGERIDASWMDKEIVGGRVHLGIVGEQSSPKMKDGLVVWTEGEYYNKMAIEAYFKVKASSLSALFIWAAQQNCLADLLAKLDGIFCAVIFDQKRRELKLISDRLGIKPLYYWKDQPFFSWASEQKAFLSIPEFAPRINKGGLQCFMDLGFMLGETTWFQKVKLLKSSTILTYSLLEKKITSEQKYWSWETVQPQNVKFDEAVEEVHRLFKQAIKKRYSNDLKMCVALSGGLDSRYIAEFFAKHGGESLFTVGKENCLDIELAKKVAKVLDLKHQVYHLNQENWFEGKLKAIWQVDGMGTIQHLHFPQKMKEAASTDECNLNGFWGDAIIGGTLITKSNQPLNKKVQRRFFGKHSSLIDFADHFFHFSHEDPALMEGHGRGTTNQGSILFEKYMPQRKPFIDNDLLQFIYSLDDNYRINNRLYAALLQRYSRKELLDIPWQKTLLAPKYDFLNRKVLQFKVVNIFRRLHLLPANYGFVDYKNWYKTPVMLHLMKGLLKPEHAVYPKYIHTDFYQNYVIKHLEGKGDYSEMISRAITLEYWLRCVAARKEVVIDVYQ